MLRGRPPVSPERAASVWRLPGYRPFYLAATLGRVADEMLPVAVVLFVLERTGSPGLAGATVAAASLPSLLTGPVLGAWLDRTVHRRAALAANQAVLAAALAGMLLVAGQAPGWVVLALAVAGGAGAPMLTGGVTSMIPLLVPPPLLVRANALEAASFNGAGVLAPALAGTAAVRLGPATAVGIEAAIAVVGIAVIACMQALGRPEPGDGEGAIAGLAGTLRAGLAHLLRTPVLRGVTVTSSLALGAQGLLPLALPLLCERLGASRGDAGYLFAVLECGGIAGAFLAVRVAAGWPAERVVMGGTALLAAGTACWALVPSLAAALVVAAVSGLVAGPAFAALFSVRQRWSPAGLRSQIFTTAASLKIGAYAVGAVLAGEVVTGIGPRGAVALTAAVELLAVAAGLASARRSPGAPRGTPTQGDVRRGDAAG